MSGQGEDAAPRAPIEFRESNVSGVNFAQRIIEVIAVPYEQTAPVEYRGQVWDEMFLRGSFDGIEKRPNRVRSNRDHDDKRLVGRAHKFWPSRQEGLVAEIRISQTPLGDETLALANDDVLGVSVGFAALGRDQEFDKRSMTRRIKKAYLDHVAFTPTPAYAGAGVLAVRSGVQVPTSQNLPMLETPALDDLRAWLQKRNAK